MRSTITQLSLYISYPYPKADLIKLLKTIFYLIDQGARRNEYFFYPLCNSLAISVLKVSAERKNKIDYHILTKIDHCYILSIQLYLLLETNVLELNDFSFIGRRYKYYIFHMSMYKVSSNPKESHLITFKRILR
jgi:hypothetical protein